MASSSGGGLWVVRCHEMHGSEATQNFFPRTRWYSTRLHKDVKENEKKKKNQKGTKKPEKGNFLQRGGRQRENFAVKNPFTK